MSIARRISTRHCTAIRSAISSDETTPSHWQAWSAHRIDAARRIILAIGLLMTGLFDVLLSFERQDYAVAFGQAKLVESRQLFSGVARFPLGVTVCDRRFAEAVLYVARTGSPWRDLPKELGNWQLYMSGLPAGKSTASQHRVWLRLRQAARLEELFIDATIVRPLRAGTQKR